MKYVENRVKPDQTKNLKKKKKMHGTQVQGNQVPKRRYRYIKHHYRA